MVFGFCFRTKQHNVIREIEEDFGSAVLSLRIVQRRAPSENSDHQITASQPQSGGEEAFYCHTEILFFARPSLLGRRGSERRISHDPAPLLGLSGSVTALISNPES